MPWAIEWKRGEKPPILLGINHAGLPELPNHAKGLSIMLFSTRKEAEECIKKHYAYIKHRPDLRRAPHNWRMPRPVKIELKIERKKETRT